MDANGAVGFFDEGSVLVCEVVLVFCDVVACDEGCCCVDDGDFTEGVGAFLPFGVELSELCAQFFDGDVAGGYRVGCVCCIVGDDADAVFGGVVVDVVDVVEVGPGGCDGSGGLGVEVRITGFVVSDDIGGVVHGVFLSAVRRATVPVGVLQGGGSSLAHTSSVHPITHSV